jgi:predicted hydrocarbon binding protein
LFVFWAIYKRNVSALLILGGLAGLIQVLDAGVGPVQQDVGKTVGPIVIAAFQFVALFYLRKSVGERTS